MGVQKKSTMTDSRLERRKSISICKITGDDSVDSFIDIFNKHLHYTIMKDRTRATNLDYYQALAFTVKEKLAKTWIKTQQRYYQKDYKRVYYLSLEYFIGKTLTNTLINLDISDICKQAMSQLALDIEELAESEEDAGLGNGGLGRLAACFLESMATLGIPAHGYGLRYDYGIFTQKIVEGEQVEIPDNWLVNGNAWEQERDRIIQIEFYGEVTADGKWSNTRLINALPYDYFIPGYQNNVVNTLRLWRALSPENFDLQCFNAGDYINAVLGRYEENLTRVLYPDDTKFEGQMLRLQQEHFLTAATLRDIVDRYKRCKVGSKEPVRTSFKSFADKVAIQLNDTHPSIAIPELMRILLDVENLGWEESWNIVVKTIAFTNHTLLPEALEKWPVKMFKNLLPRHFQIICEINFRFLKEVNEKYPGDNERIKRMSIFQGQGDNEKINMAHLCVVGSHAVNGVAALHSELLKKELFKDFYEMTPDKFQNKTNGVTPRRWLLLCNPGLSNLITKQIGSSWIRNLDELQKLKKFVSDENFIDEIIAVKKQNKQRLQDKIYGNYHINLNMKSMFDIQVKRMHQYKRQVLNCLHIIYLFNKIKRDPKGVFTPRTVFIGGKSPPGYAEAKDIIKLVCAISEVVNNDSDMGDNLKVIYLENYRVSLAEIVIPAADLSEQISTAGTEASGTSNMKFMMNGALTMGTLDGATVEMLEEVGRENMFTFGMNVDQVRALQGKGYDASHYYNSIPHLKLALDQLKDGFFSPFNPTAFHEIVNYLMYRDKYYALADYESFIEAQEKVSAFYIQEREWAKMTVINIASSGKFSSDRTIAEYARDIWGVKPSAEIFPKSVISEPYKPE